MYRCAGSRNLGAVPAGPSAITRQLSARLEAAHGLTLSDYDVLVQLYYAPERALRRVDLARTVLLTASGITRLLDGLERCGWVEKRACAATPASPTPR